MTHWKKLTNPEYLGAYSIEDGRDLVLTIKSVGIEKVVGADGKKEDCVVCHWVENAKPMILNSTNMKMITKLLNTPYIEQWAGHKIQIGVEKVKAFGDVVDALRVRKSLPKDKTILCERCGKPIMAAFNMTAEQFAAYTKKNTGTSVCAACAKQISEERRKKAEAAQEAPEVLDDATDEG